MAQFFFGSDGNDLRTLLVRCSEDRGNDQTNDQTVVTIETGGFTGKLIFARIERGSFHSGDILVKLFDGISIPEARTYIDLDTNGKKFLLTYDFINKGQFARLIYNDDTKTIPSTNKLICEI